MGLKDWIFTDEEGEDKQDKQEKSSGGQTSFESKFPTSTDSVAPKETFTTTAPAAVTHTSTPITPDNPACAPHLDNIMAMYELGFDGLNQDGYDFYEYFKSVVQGGINNPSVYTMAYTMGQTMDDTVNKSTLLTQSQFYLTEINKVYEHYVASGNAKRQEAITARTSEESDLTNELTGINNEIVRLNQLKAQKEGELSTIDGKYQPQITEIECKLMANDMANNAITGSINKVVDGINKNV